MRCQAQTKAGKPCRMQATQDGYCYTHSPELAAERAASRRRGGRHRRRPRATPPKARLRSLDDVLAALETALGDAYALDAGTTRCRVVVYTCSTALKTLETKTLDELAARVARLEQQREAA